MGGADVEARSHILRTCNPGAAPNPEFEELGADVAIIHNGRIAARGSLEKIIANYARNRSTNLTCSFY